MGGRVIDSSNGRKAPFEYGVLWIFLATLMFWVVIAYMIVKLV